MSNDEKKISEYIDSLNAEMKPKEHGNETDSPELEQLMKTVRQVKSLREPVMPDAGYHKKIAQSVNNSMPQKLNFKKSRKSWFVGFTAVAAAVIMILTFNFTFSFGNNNIVYAMEQAFKEVKAYHGLLEITQTSAEGKHAVQAKIEVWADKSGHYYLKEIDGSQVGLITINNGQKKWQIRPDQKQVNVFPAFPDPYRFIFELGKEVDDAKNAIDTRKLGEEQISGREVVVLEVTPKGGAAYKLWIDKETKLPLKKQSAMQNALQYTITYTDIDFNDSIPAELLAYELPTGYKEISMNAELLVNSIDEAQEIAGFMPRVPETITAGYEHNGVAIELNKKVIKLYYTNKDKQNTVIVLQGKALGEFKPASTAVLGKVGEQIAEIQSPVNEDSGILVDGGVYTGVTGLSSIRWQTAGYEYAVVGDISIEDLSSFAKGIAKADVQIPSKGELTTKPQVEVPVDLTVEENDQKSVDAGHSPWKLDPVFVSQVFVSLKISPEGIVGDYPIKYESFETEQNTGTEAIIKVNDAKSPISKVYLKKLVRPDSTGIWTVVGYDPVEKN